MLTLGLDHSFSSFGWALYDDEAILFDRCPQKGILPKPGTKVLIERLIHYREALTSLLSELSFDYVGIEYPVFGQTYSEGMFALFNFCCEALLKAKVDVVFINNSHVKVRVRKYLGRPSKWKVKKVDTLEAAYKDTGEMGRWRDDEADAYWIAYNASRFWHYRNGDLDLEDLEPFEAKQIDHRHTYTRGKKAGLTERKGLIYQENDMFFLWSQREE